MRALLLILVSLTLPALSFGGVVQSAKGQNPLPGNTTLTMGGTTSSGNLILVGCAAWGTPSSLSTPTDTSGNSYTLIKSAQYEVGTNIPMALYYAIAGTNSTLTITCHVSNPGGESSMVAVEISDILPSPIDTSASISFQGGNSVMTPSITTTSANEILIGYAANNSTSESPTQITGYTALQTTCGCDAVEASILEYQQVSTTGSYTAGATTSNTVNWGAIVVGIKVSSTPTVTPTIGPTGAINPAPSGAKNVKTDCGATGNGSTDDATAINNCIASLSAGQTLYFPDGTYMISTFIHFVSGHTYLGRSNNAIIKQITNGDTVADTDFASPLNILIDTLTFDGGTFYLNGPSSGACGITVQNSIFQNNTAPPPGSFESAMFIMVENGLGGCTQGVRLHNNKFMNLLYNMQTRADIPGHTNWPDYDESVPRSAIMSYGFDRTSIDHNIFDDVYEGVKGCFAHTYVDQNPYIGYNIFTQPHRMPIEIQGGDGCGHATGLNPDSVNLTIEYNYAYNWNDYYFESYGISLADFFNQDSIIRNNVIIASVYHNDNGQGIGYETGGRPEHVYNNLGMGPWGMGVAVFDFSISPEVNNNWFCQLNDGQTSPIVGDENNGFGPPPTDPNYHDNFLHNSCTPVNVGGIIPTTSVSLGSATVTSGVLTAASTTTTFNPSVYSVGYYVDGSATPIASASISAYTLLDSSTLPSSLNTSTSGLSTGNHTLVAKAFDVWGNTWSSNSQVFNVPSAPSLTTPFQLIGASQLTGGAALIGAGGDGGAGAISGGGSRTINGFIGGPPQMSVNISGSSIGGSSAVGTNSGAYHFSNLRNGTYTITPSIATGYTFTPTSTNVTISGADNTAADLIATTTLAKLIHDNETGLHEAPTDGIPPTWDGYLGPTTSGTLQNSIGTHQAVLPWFSLQVAPGGNPATNAIVNIRNVKMCVLSGSPTATWSCSTYTNSQIDGEWDSEDFSNFVGSWSATALGDGTATIPMHTGFTACNGSDPTYSQTQNCVSHFYPDTRKAVNPATIVGFVSYLEARVVKNNPAGVDDRANSKVLIIAGADAYNSTTSNDDPDVRPAIGYGKYKYVQGEWRSFAMTTLTESQLAANPPPITITGIAP